VGYLVLNGLQWKRGSMIAWIMANVVEIEGGGYGAMALPE
jgi:hypothetical protein